VEDNCDGVFTPSVADGGKTLTSGDSECTTYSQTWTATYTDACDSDAVPVGFTYTWKEDLVVPVIPTNDTDVGCNQQWYQLPTTQEKTIGVFAPSVSDGGKTLTSGDSNCDLQPNMDSDLYRCLFNVAIPVSVTHMERRLRCSVISTTDADGGWVVIQVNTNSSLYRKIIVTACLHQVLQWR
jgi:hypothetical protein